MPLDVTVFLGMISNNLILSNKNKYYYHEALFYSEGLKNLKFIEHPCKDMFSQDKQSNQMTWLQSI